MFFFMFDLFIVLIWNLMVIGFREVVQTMQLLSNMSKRSCMWGQAFYQQQNR